MATAFDLVVPGSTSNLGAGFDALGVALRVYLRLRVRVGGTAGVRSGPDAVRWRFVGMPEPGDNAIERGFRALADSAAGPPLPDLDVEVRSDIPTRSGLGSSAAAIVAGLRLFEAVTGARPVDDLLAVAARLEGHPDNTSPSLLGGFVASVMTPHGRVGAVATRWPDDLRLVVATPAAELETRRARAALRPEVPLSDAVYNIQRAALLVQSIATRDYRFLREAFRDRLHQEARAPLVPGLREALALDHPSLVGVFLSGAGPSVVAVVHNPGGGDQPGAVAEVASGLAGVYERLGLATAVREIPVHQPGAAAGC